MSDPETPGKVALADDPQAWVMQQLGEGAPEAVPTAEPDAPSPAPEAEPAPTQAAPEPAPSWRDFTIPEDDPVVKNKFFVGKKAEEIYRSYEAIIPKFNEQGHRISQLEAELAANRAIKDLLPQLAPKEQPQPSPLDDPNLIFEDPARYKALVLEEARSMARQEAAAAAAEIRNEQTQTDRTKQTISALAAAQNQLQLSNEQFGQLVPGLMSTVAYKYGNDALLDPAAYLSEFNALASAVARPTAAPSAPPPVPAAPAPPPGAKRAASADLPSGKFDSITLKAEDRQLAEQTWNSIKDLSPNMSKERFFASYASNLGKIKER